MAESSSTPPSISKPVILRVKRKAFQSALDAFWLEIHERPIKRPLLDLGRLSIYDASSSRVEELKTKKILVQHVETITSFESTFDVLQSFVPDVSCKLKYQNEEGNRNFKTVNKQDQLLVKAKERQEVVSRNARFEQIWRSKKEKKEAPEDAAIYEMCRLYDVVRVDVEEQEVEVQKEKDTDLEDHRMMAQYLPLLREVLPAADVEIDSDIHDFMSKQASSDDYVYDFYAINEVANMVEGDSATSFPLVQVNDDDEFYDGVDSEYETDDSNAEDNPLNEYPDEGTSEDEDEVTRRPSDEQSEGGIRTSGSQSEELENGSQVSIECDELYNWTNNANHDFEDELYSEGDSGRMEVACLDSDCFAVHSRVFSSF